MNAIPDNFNTDFGTLQTDAEQFNGFIEQQKADLAAYDAEYQAILSIKNPEILFMKFFYLLGNLGFRLMDDTLAIWGSSLKIQGDLTKLHNDMQKLTTADYSGIDANGLKYYLKSYTSHLDLMLNLFSPNTLTPGAEQPWYAYVQEAIAGTENPTQSIGGGAAGQQLYGNYITLRHQVNWSEDPDANDDPNQAYNPTPTTPWNQAPINGAPRNYYFDPDAEVSPTIGSDGQAYGPTNDNQYMSNFDDSKTYLGEQGNIDLVQSASTAMTQAQGSATSTTQSVAASSNVMITQVKNQTQTVQAFTNQMLHAQSDTIKAAIQNTGKQ